MTQRAYKYRFYPTPEQKRMFNLCFSHSRWVWNYALQRRQKAYRRRGERLSGVDISRELTRLKKLPRYAWLADIPSTVIAQKLRDQDTAFKNWWGGRAQRPRFRKRRIGGRQSVRFQLDQRQLAKLWRPQDLHLALPRLGPLKLRWSRLPPTSAPGPKMATILRDACGRWFVSVTVEEEIQRLKPAPNEAVGIDVGLRDLIMPSRGTPTPNPRHLKRRLRQLRRAQRDLSRKQKGSGRWHQQRQRVARLQCRVADARRDALHTATTTLVRESQATGWRTWR